MLWRAIIIGRAPVHTTVPGTESAANAWRIIGIITKVSPDVFSLPKRKPPTTAVWKCCAVTAVWN